MLHLHRAERADGLVDALREILAAPLDDPFAPEVVAVPTRGMERWLSQRMADRLGVCANVAFPSPRRLTGDAVATASGIDADTDPWLPERMVWPLLDVVDDCLDEPWLEVLARHLEERERARRFSTLRHLAGLYDRYALHRPDMVRAWAAGRDDDGAGAALAPEFYWQAELFRRLRDRIAVPDLAERVEGACVRLRDEPAIVELPPRLSVFGLTRLPAGRLQVLRALAAGRDVHLFLLHPSPQLWHQIAGASDGAAVVPENALLTSWGQDSREMQLVLAATEHEDHHHPVEQPTGTLLARLQADVHADRSPPGPPLPGRPDARPVLDDGDRSVAVHACHGRARQVEVLRDAILHLLADDPTLEPRDVIVMCPDIETFAPLIHATFGAGDAFAADDEIAAIPADVRPADLRIRLADRSLRQTNPVLGVVSRLIELGDARVTASQVLDLVDREPVRRRFGFDDQDLARLEEWVADSGIRWGLDAEHREPFRLSRLAAGTWRAGLDRVLVGVTMTEEGGRLFGDVLPLDDVDSGAIDLAGRFAELVDRLTQAIDALRAAKTISGWTHALGAAADALTATSERDAWQRAELDRLLAAVLDEAGEAGAELELADVRALLADRLAGRPTRANFRTGHLTICTLMPMRSVPHRVVCLLGMDDGVFPRKSPRDGDDLMVREPHLGDRDPRTEDRQLLLDALLAATDRLLITYTGNDERTNLPRPPAVPVGELLDVIDATVRTEDGARPRDRIVAAHPLQPFDPRNFRAPKPWSFDAVTLAGARALAADREPVAPFLAGPLPAVEEAIVELDDLVRFVEHPVRAFLRQRLGVRVGDSGDETADALPIGLDHLEQWQIGDRLLAGVLAGADLEACAAAEIARGTLPPDRLAGPVLDEIRPRVEAIAREARCAGAPGSVDVKTVLDDGRTLSGTVPGVYGDVLRTAIYSRVGPKHRLAAWVRLLALTCAHPERSFEAVTVGRARYGAPRDATVTIARIAPLATAEARAHLSALVDLWDRGLREPLPLYCKTSAAYAAGQNARKEWTSDWNVPKEDAELEHQLVLGGIAAFDDIATPGFEHYARQLWDGILAAEEMSER